MSSFRGGIGGSGGGTKARTVSPPTAVSMKLPQAISLICAFLSFSHVRNDPFLTNLTKNWVIAAFSFLCEGHFLPPNIHINSFLAYPEHRFRQQCKPALSQASGKYVFTRLAVITPKDHVGLCAGGLFKGMHAVDVQFMRRFTSVWGRPCKPCLGPRPRLVPLQ